MIILLSEQTEAKYYLWHTMKREIATATRQLIKLQYSVQTYEIADARN